MKRVGNLYDEIISLENLYLADSKAMKGKKRSYGVQRHLKNRDNNLLMLHESLKSQSFKTSSYDIFQMIADSNKLRTIYRLPYYPDRIVHHAVINVLEPIWVNMFITNTYSCIKGRGVHKAHYHLLRDLKDVDGTKYCLKIDVRKYYPSIDHDILKSLLRRKIKDARLLILLDEIIDSAPGVPIGNYLSQYFANVYLNYFDHYMKEVERVKYYYRYADDIVVLHPDKSYLHGLFSRIEAYMRDNLNLSINKNHQVFPIDKRPLDFLGYVYTHNGSRLRKRIKQSFFRKMAYLDRKGLESKDRLMSLAAYRGWLQHCNCNRVMNLI